MADGTEEQLTWEARQRPRAAVAAVAAGVLALGASVFTQMLFSDAPRASFLVGLDNVAQPGPVAEHESLKARSYEFYDDHASSILGIAALRALGMLALGYALIFLARATKARREELPRLALYVPIVGSVLLAFGTVLTDVGIGSAVNTFLDGPHTVDRARDVSESSLVLAAQLIGVVGTVTVALAFVLVCLNAMRAGLLTRFMGVLGILVGVLIVFPIGSPVPVVQSFWFLALAALFAGRWPNGVPPAWRTGRAEPWPSQQEIREQRQRAAARRRGEPQPEAKAEPAEPVGVAAPGKQHPSSRKKKRKRRT